MQIIIVIMFNLSIFWQFGDIYRKFYPGTNLVGQNWSGKFKPLTYVLFTSEGWWLEAEGPKALTLGQYIRVCAPSFF